MKPYFQEYKQLRLDRKQKEEEDKEQRKWEKYLSGRRYMQAMRM